VLERLRGAPAAGAGGGIDAVPGGVGTEITLTRSHLVEAAGREFIEPHEGVGLQGGAVWVPGRVWRGIVPFFHKEVLAFKLQLGVGATRGGRGVYVSQEVLRGDREGGVAIRAKEEEH